MSFSCFFLCFHLITECHTAQTELGKAVKKFSYLVATTSLLIRCTPVAAFFEGLGGTTIQFGLEVKGPKKSPTNKQLSSLVLPTVLYQHSDITATVLVYHINM